MRKTIAVGLAGLSVVILTASPALALKDPFDPLVTPDSTTGEVDGSTTTVDAPAASTNENPFSENMPTTGAATASWLVLAYVLLVVGAAALALAWTRRPAPVGREVFRP
jgi:hypothetical protein